MDAGFDEDVRILSQSVPRIVLAGWPDCGLPAAVFSWACVHEDTKAELEIFCVLWDPCGFYCVSLETRNHLQASWAL